MPIINGRFYSAFGHYSPYVSSIIQRYRMRQANDHAAASLEAFTTGLSNAAVNQIQGYANIAAQRALDRINAETEAKKAEQSPGIDDIVIDAPKSSVFNLDSSTTLSGGLQIDLDNNTLTLPDGTVIDLTTGLEKVDVVV
jgi:hypothetical protein